MLKEVEYTSPDKITFPRNKRLTINIPTYTSQIIKTKENKNKNKNALFIWSVELLSSFLDIYSGTL